MEQQLQQPAEQNPVVLTQTAATTDESQSSVGNRLDPEVVDRMMRVLEKQEGSGGPDIPRSNLTG